MPSLLQAQFNVGSNDIPLLSSQENKLAALFDDYSVIQLESKDLNNHLKNQTSSASILLMAGDSTWLLELEENEIRSSDMIIMRSTLSGDFIDQKGECNTYKGYVNNDTNQIARFFISEREISGYFVSYGKQFEIDPAPDLLQEPFDPSLQDTYVLYESTARLDTSDFICLTEVDTIVPSGSFNENLDWRTDCDELSDLDWNNNPRYIELAVETDWDFFQMYGGDISLPPEQRKELVIDEIERRINEIDGLYAQFNLYVILTYVHLWDVPATTDDPYDYDGLEANWDQVKNYWNNNLTNVHRDHVHFFSGKELDGFGVVNGPGIPSLCGSDNPVYATHDNGHYWSWSYSVSSEETSTNSNKDLWQAAAHEIGHTMDIPHICKCGIMDSGQDCMNAGPCPANYNASNFADTTKRLICKYLNGLNGPYSRSNDACLVEPPPLNYAFDLILEANQVVIGNFGEVVCAGDTIKATFYNQFDPYTNISWSYNNLTLLNDPAANIKEFQTTTTGDASISVTFDYQGQTVTYERRFHIGPPTELMGPYGIQITPNSSPGTWDIFFYEVSYATFYAYRIDGFNAFGQPIFSESGTTTELNPFYTIPNDICVQVTMRAGNDCGVSSQYVQFDICPPGYSGGPFRAADTDQQTNVRKSSPSKSNAQQEVILFPNPTSKWLTVQISNQQIIESYDLFDAQGQKIGSDRPNKQALQIRMPEIAGVYWIRLQTSTGSLLKKIIVNN